MSQGTFNKVKPTDRRMFGPRKLLVCGWPAGQQSELLQLLEKIGITEAPVIFLTDDQLDQALEQVLELPHCSGLGQTSNTPRAVVLSGLTEQELHAVISAYRRRRLPEQLWASLTPTSARWPVRRLLRELASEREAFQRMQAQKKRPR